MTLQIPRWHASIGECAFCGRRRYLSKHHVKEYGHENDSQKFRTGQVVYICLSCHWRIHRLTMKRDTNANELSMPTKFGMTVGEFRIMRGMRMLESVSEWDFCQTCRVKVRADRFEHHMERMHHILKALEPTT